MTEDDSSSFYRFINILEFCSSLKEITDLLYSWYGTAWYSFDLDIFFDVSNISEYTNLLRCALVAHRWSPFPKFPESL